MKKTNSEIPSFAQKEPLWTKDFLMISALNFFLFVSYQIFPAALPPYMKSLGASDSVLGWITGVATISTLVIRPITGIMLDSLGRKLAMIGGLVICTICTFIFYFFPVVGVILFLRFVQGIGIGMATTASNTVATDCIPKSRFGEGMGYFTLTANLGMAIAPAIGLAMLPGPMILTTTAGFAFALIVSLLMKYRPVTPRPDIGGKKPFPYAKSAVIPAIVLMLSTTGFGAIVTFLAIYAEHVGVKGNIGVFFTVYAIVVLVTRPHTGKLVDKKGPEFMVVPALLLNMAGLFIISQATDMSAFLVSAAVFGLGQSATVTSTQAMAILNSPPHRKGAATATFYTGFDLGLGLGAMVSGYLAALFGYSGMYMVTMAMPGMAVVIFVVSQLLKKKK